MAVYRDEGIVLKTVKLGEADRIVTILTQRHGKVRAVAKGVRRTKSRFGGRLEPFMRADLLLAEGRTFETVSQAVTIAQYGGPITADYDAFTAASTVVETANDLVAAEKEPAPAQYRLVIGALNALAKHRHDSRAIALSYVMRALAAAGWTPLIDRCVVCGGAERLDFFSARSGGAMCFADHTPDARHVSAEVLRELRALLEGDWDLLDRLGGAAIPTDASAATGSAVITTAATSPAATSPELAGGNGIAAPVSTLDPQTVTIVEDWAEAVLERPLRSMRVLG
ncbi:DNA repair protein RecO [Bifidobacterium choloepi]|uniref:DNA repair protein RecO n=1 Tax=Bifidobacterium choloepi TaxID=2614131 RepID=A0A6I5N0Z6_9BIFI|nr:DNA repair protein RecO [Bifidobacterium choloepi]NEG70608.1 DNA repair protein RecO [Bifidobacterium choloepi]